MKNLRAAPGGREPTPRERFDEYRRRAFDIAQMLTLNEPVASSLQTIASVTEMTQSQVHEMKDLLVHIGSLEWHRGDAGIGVWTLLHPTDQMFNALELEMERQMRGGRTISQLKRQKASGTTRQSQEKVAVQEDRLGFAVGAVAGPEAPNILAPLRGMGPDAPGALVMAAKQYHGGEGPEQRKAARLVADLNEIGVSVPPELAAKARPQKDDRLEAIRLVLPYIEDLERRLVAATDRLRSMGDYGKLKEINRRQHEQIERLVAQRTADAMSREPHRG